MSEWILRVDELEPLIEDIKNRLPNGGVVMLRGDLAAGKTTFVKEFVKAQGVNEVVTSPTFSLQQQYGESIFHYDIYNQGVEQFLALGLLEELENSGFHFIEWGDDTLINILQKIGIEITVIDILKESRDSRVYRIANA